MQGRYRSLEDGRAYTPNPNSNSSFRNFNNRSNTSYNRGNNFNRRPYLPPPPLSKQEILMRAGKLAAEYLVSQGLLDPEKLPRNRGQNGKYKDCGGLKYDEDNDSENEADYGRSEYYRERKSGFNQLPSRSENTMESRSENQDFAEDGGSNISSLSLKKDALCEVVGDNVVTNSEVSEEVQSDADNDSKMETIVEDNNKGDDDDAKKAIAEENINIELKEEEKETDLEEKSSNKRKREDDEVPINNVKVKESGIDEEIDVPIKNEVEKIEGEIGDKIEEEEKQISSTPLETCDLNLMHGNEVAENDNRKEFSMNIELATSNNDNGCGEFDKISNADDKAVQLSKIEVDVTMDGSSFDPSNLEDKETIREEPVYPNLDSFLNQHEHADLNGIHDGYSLDFPNFLGSDITRCPLVPTDLNNLGSEMEGVPNDDDSIYVSLGEIPIGFMEVWDPPAQDYGKFF